MDLSRFRASLCWIKITLETYGVLDSRLSAQHPHLNLPPSRGKKILSRTRSYHSAKDERFVNYGTLPPQSSFRKPLFSKFSAKLLSIKSVAFLVTLVPDSRTISTPSVTAFTGTIIRRLMSRFA